MPNDIIKKDNQLHSPAAPIQVNIGPKANYFEHVDNLNLTEKHINISTTVNGNTITSNIQPNNDYYNLFVLDSEEFAKGYFVINRQDALLHLDNDAKEIHRKDNFNSLIRCLLYPCLFANKNSVSYKKAADNQLSYFGYLANIEETQEGYKFFFSIVSSLPQNIFNDNCAAFNLKTSIGENELDKVHWSIKKKDIVKSIRSLGFNVAAY